MFHNKNKLNSNILLYGIVIWLLACSLGSALPSDKHKNAIIKADNSKMNFNTGVHILNGHVRIDQGTTHLTGNKVIVYTNKQNQLIKAIATGRQAHYWTLPNIGKPVVHANADMMKYFPNKNLIVLLGNAKVSQQNNSLQGPVIIYNSQTDTVTTPPSKNGRTTIIYHPKSTAKTDPRKQNNNLREQHEKSTSH